jgi:hypothetical protein
MKKYIITNTLLICAYFSFAQNTNSILIRHDTAVLKATECEWIIKSLAENDPSLTSEIGKPVPQIILEAIGKGKLKAIDPETNKSIPAKEIFTWKLAPDTILISDPEGEGKGGLMYNVIERLHYSNNFNEISIYQDWYFNISTGKFYSEIKWIELREDVRTSMGTLLGTVALCRIYY